MNLQRFFPRVTLAVSICGVVAGCATMQKPAPLAPDVFNKQLADADAVWKAGDKPKAIALYQALAKDDPTREEPWSRIAQVEFTQAHYGQAIVAAQEALQRDDTDREAKSVLAVSGLRVATESLAQLRKDSDLVGDATMDARILAQQLRDTLGEDTLFPADEKEAPKSRHPRRRRHAPAVKAGASDAAATTSSATPPAPTATTAPTGAAAKSDKSDPFSALR